MSVLSPRGISLGSLGSRRTRGAGSAGVTSGGIWSVGSGSRATGSNDFVDLATRVVILRMPPETSCVAVGLATTVGLALVRFFVTVC